MPQIASQQYLKPVPGEDVPASNTKVKRKDVATEMASSELEGLVAFKYTHLPQTTMTQQDFTCEALVVAICVYL